MKKFSIKIKHKPERLTAAQARAISIDNSFVENVLQEMYKTIRVAASCGKSEIFWYHSSFSNNVKEIVKQRLEDDGYYIDNTTSIFSWKITWRELE